MKTVKDLLLNKQNLDAHSILPGATVWEAISLMSDQSIGALLVIDGSKLVGVLSERDYLRKVALKGRASQTTAVEEIMTPNPFTVSPDTSLDICMELMTQKRIRHLPVTHGDEVLGMLSIRDVLEAVMEEQKHLILQLEQYIRGESY